MLKRTDQPTYSSSEWGYNFLGFFLLTKTNTISNAIVYHFPLMYNMHYAWINVTKPCTKPNSFYDSCFLEHIIKKSNQILKLLHEYVLWASFFFPQKLNTSPSISWCCIKPSQMQHFMIPGDPISLFFTGEIISVWFFPCIALKCLTLLSS